MKCPDMCPDEYCDVNQEGTPWKANMKCTKYPPKSNDRTDCCRCASNSYPIGVCAPGCTDKGTCVTDGKSYPKPRPKPRPRPNPVPVKPIPPFNPFGVKNGGSPAGKPSKLNGGEIAGIVVGSVAGLALIIFLICMLAKKKKR